MMSLKIFVCIFSIIISCRCERVFIDLNTADQCDQTETYAIAFDDIYTLYGLVNETNNVPCNVSFTSTVHNGCNGLCYMFNYYNEINDANVTFKLGNTTDTATFQKSDQFQAREQVCTEGTDLHLQKTIEPEFEYTNETVQYRIFLSVYHNCGVRAAATSITFEEALKHIKGFYHGQAKEDREHESIMEGVGVSLGFASVFIVGFGVGLIYTKCLT